MGVDELMEMKAQYEREVLFAQAKVTVIDDLISRAEAKACAEQIAFDEVAPEPDPAPTTTDIDF